LLRFPNRMLRFSLLLSLSLLLLSFGTARSQQDDGSLVIANSSDVDVVVFDAQDPSFSEEEEASFSSFDNDDDVVAVLNDFSDLDSSIEYIILEESDGSQVEISGFVEIEITVVNLPEGAITLFETVNSFMQSDDEFSQLPSFFSLPSDANSPCGDNSHPHPHPMAYVEQIIGLENEDDFSIEDDYSIEDEMEMEDDMEYEDDEEMDDMMDDNSPTYHYSQPKEFPLFFHHGLYLCIASGLLLASLAMCCCGSRRSRMVDEEDYLPLRPFASPSEEQLIEMAQRQSLAEYQQHQVRMHDVAVGGMEYMRVPVMSPEGYAHYLAAATSPRDV